MFERDQQEEVDLLREEANSNVVSRIVDQPVVESANSQEKSDKPVNEYLSELERFDGKHRQTAAA